MAERGYIRLYRGWRNSDVFRDEPCSEREAWVWLLEEAAYKPRQREVNGTTVKLDRGQAALSSRFLARAWDWREPRVRRFLERLEAHGMIELRRSRPVNVITITNYDAYQGVRDRVLTNAGTDAPIDAGSDAGSDAGRAVEADAPDTADDCDTAPATHAGVEGSADAGADAGTDALSNTGTDANKNEGAHKEGALKVGGAREARQSTQQRGRDPPNRGHRLPDDWMPKVTHYELGRNKMQMAADEVDYEADKFRDHFHAASGQSARKRDWDRAFNNWLRRAAEGRQRGAARDATDGGRGPPASVTGVTADLVSRHGSG